MKFSYLEFTLLKKSCDNSESVTTNYELKLKVSICPLPIDKCNCFSSKNKIDDELHFLFNYDCNHDLQ